MPSRKPAKISLSAEQEDSLQTVLSSFPKEFAENPGITLLILHSITLTSQTPVWTPAYTVPLAYQKDFREEIETLLNLEIIEPSMSKWSPSPLPVKRRTAAFV